MKLKYDRKGESVPEKKTVYDTGATRSGDAKGVRYDLVPPEGVEAVARAMHVGAEHHGDNNWKKGLKNSVYDLGASWHLDIDEAIKNKKKER